MMQGLQGKQVISSLKRLPACSLGLSIKGKNSLQDDFGLPYSSGRESRPARQLLNQQSEMSKTSQSPSRSKRKQSTGDPGPKEILVIDIGGSKTKILASGQTEPRKMRSAKGMTPGGMVKAVQKLARGWRYEAVSIGYPGKVGDHGPRSEPGNLGAGWVGFDFAAAFGCPVRVINDAAMQALGCYEGGRMLFLGLGTGLGSALIAEQVIVPLELGQLSYGKNQMLSDVAGNRGLKRLGREKWCRVMTRIVVNLMDAFAADHVVVGGGNAEYFKDMPPGMRVGHNLTAFRGGFRLWNVDDVQTLSADHEHPAPFHPGAEWKLI
jgi:polyphosphate glucokinase